MAVTIPVITEYVGKGVDAALKQFKQLETVGQKAGFVFKNAITPGAIAAGGAIVTLGGTMYGLAKAAAEAEAEDAKLAQQLRNTVGATDGAIEATMAFVDALEMETTIAGGTLADALGVLIRYTGNTRAAQEQLALATDIAAASGKDLESVSLALGKAYNGEFTALTKLGIPIDDNIIKTKDYTKVQELLNKQFGGAAANAADTFTGQMARLRIGLEKIYEALGEILLPYLERFVSFINTSIIPAVRKFIDRLVAGDSISEAFKTAVGAMGEFAPAAIRAMKAASNAVLEFIQTIVKAYVAIQGLKGLIRTLASRGRDTGGLLDLAKAITGGAGIVGLEVLQNKTNSFFDDLLNNLDEYQTKARNTTISAGDSFERIRTSLNWEFKPKIDPDDTTGKKVDALAEKAKKLKERTEQAAKALKEEMADALDDAKDRLATATEAFTDFATSVSGVIKETLSFKDAFEKSAEEGGKSFFDELQAQANKAKDFGALVEQLLKAGISKEALDQVLAAGVDSGTAIAKELLKSAENVLRANKLVEETQAIADKIGLAAANKFYLAGVENGKAYLRGVEEIIASANARLALARTPADVKGTQALFGLGMANAGNVAGVVNNYNITAQSLDPRSGADAVVDALTEYNRRSGPVQVEIA